MYKIILSLLLVLSLAEVAPSGLHAQEGNPIMIIRCRYAAPAFTSDDTKVLSKRIEDPCPEIFDLSAVTIPDENGNCVPVCYNGEINMKFAPLDCSQITSGEIVETEACFTSADPIVNPLVVGQYVTFDEISNCLDFESNDLLTDVFLNPDFIERVDEAGFGPAISIEGTVQVCATFHVDPSKLTEANIVDATGASVSKERASADPCAAFAPAIPTLNQWALLILGLITSSLALGFMLKRKYTLV